MKSICVSDAIHKWIMDHKNSERTSAAKVIVWMMKEVEQKEQPNKGGLNK